MLLAAALAALAVAPATHAARGKNRPTKNDLDGDGRSNATDRDVDGDGRRNVTDRDVDGDRIPNAGDRNIDSDRRANWPWDEDMDGDGTPNTRDVDPDGDGRKWAVARRGRQTHGAPVPPDFFGFVHEHAFWEQGAARDALMQAARSTGAGVLRQTFHWGEIERSPGRYEFGLHDPYMAAAARHGFEVLPVLFNPPLWRSSRPADGGRRGTYPPRSNAEFAAFAADLVRRYGPGGSFWAAHPELPARPIRAWQVWNEPNLPVYWPSGVNAGQYAQMLKAVSAGIKAVDPGAEVVTAGIPESRTGVPLSRYLRAMIRGGARGAFDTLAINPYATTPEGVLENFMKARRMLDRFRAKNVRLWGTEIGWATSGPKNPFNAGPLRQGKLIERAFALVTARAAKLKVRGLVYFAWQDAHVYPGGKDFWGLHTGLLNLDGSQKPGFAAFSAAVRALTSGNAQRRR